MEADPTEIANYLNADPNHAVQINCVSIISTDRNGVTPDEIAKTLDELEGHADIRDCTYLEDSRALTPWPPTTPRPS